MGANGYESSAFQDILKKLESGEYTPQQVLTEAYKIKDSKQDYH